MTPQHLRRQFLVTLVLWLGFAAVAGCNFFLTTTYRSGTVDDDYVEEPIDGRAKKYENALLMSNAVLDRLRTRPGAAGPADAFEAGVRPFMSHPKFVALMRSTEAEVGPIKQYKRLQWGFAPTQDDEGKRLISTKLVEHERGMMRYQFVFADDGKYEQFVGFRINKRVGVAGPDE